MMRWEEMVKELTGTENDVVIISRSPAGRVRVASTYPREEHYKVLNLIHLATILERTPCDDDCVHQGLVKGGKILR